MKAIRGNNSITALYSAAHLAVDFCCAAVMFSAARYTGEGALLFLVYNFSAFALQLPIGAVVDSRGYPPLFAALGCLLVGCGVQLTGLAAAIVAGLGNATFHVGAGVDVIRRSDGKAALLGIFVSPGAIGVFLGSLLTYDIAAYSVGLSAAMAAFAILILRLCGKGEKSAPAPFDLPKSGFFIAAGLLIVVLLRSFGGMAMRFPWKSEWAYAFTACVVLGKTLGGILGDRFGFKRTAAVSLIAAAVLFMFADDNPAMGMLAALLFNMTMPLTLHRAAKLFGEYKGTAFGLLTLGLFIGFLPSYGSFSLSGGAVCALLSLLSLCLLLPCLGKEDA